MKRRQAVELEKNRTDENKGKVYLHKEGNFYRAYDYSAWLIKKFVCTEEIQKARGDENMLAVKHHKNKDFEYCFVGFPLSSLSKYILDYEAIESGEDGMLCVDVDIPETDTIDDMVLGCSEWMCSIPIIEDTKSNREIKKGNVQASVLGQSGLFSIATMVLSYPLESKTPADNMNFISELKREIIKLL